jgi:glyoxylase-like metal-dependent hydrolase (beta-lactamase superfamily II)
VVVVGGKALVVDPNQEALADVKAVLQQGRVEKIDTLITHPHNDHFDGALAVQGQYGGRILAHQTLIDLQREVGSLSVNELMDRFPSPLPFYGDFLCRWSLAYQKLPLLALEDGTIPDWPLRVYRHETITYHSPCDCIVYGDGFAFTGDLVFVRNSQFGFGRTDLPGSNEENLTDGLGELVDSLIKQCGQSQNSLLFPGHGEPFTFAELLGAMQRWIEEVPCGDD